MIIALVPARYSFAKKTPHPSAQPRMTRRVNIEHFAGIEEEALFCWFAGLQILAWLFPGRSLVMAVNVFSMNAQDHN
jgi:hypothetical protein